MKNGQCETDVSVVAGTIDHLAMTGSTDTNLVRNTQPRIETSTVRRSSRGHGKEFPRTHLEFCHALHITWTEKTELEVTDLLGSQITAQKILPTIGKRYIIIRIITVPSVIGFHVFVVVVLFCCGVVWCGVVEEECNTTNVSCLTESKKRAEDV